jgi:hypothetical protein
MPFLRSEGVPGRAKGTVMGEKGNLFDTGEDVFANLAEQGPQFWLAYEQYKDERTKSSAEEAADNEAGAQEPGANSPARTGAE